MEREQIAPHIDDIKRVLGEDVDENEIESDLRRYLEQFMVPLNEAKRSVVKKHDGDPQLLGSGHVQKLGELKGTESSVDVLCRIITVNESEGKDRSGAPATRYWGLLEDDERSLPYTAWNDFELRRGEVLQIRNAYARISPRGDIQLNLGDRASVTRMPPDSLPVRQRPEGTGGEGGGWTVSVGPKPVGELASGMSGVEVTARVLSVRERKVNVGGEDKVLYSGAMADGTGMVNFSCWHDFGLEPGMALNVKGGYVKDWRGAAQFTFDERSRVEPLEDADLPSARELALTDVVDLREGMEYVVVRGRLLSVTQRTVDARGETKTVFSGDLADGTGTIPFSAWHDFGLEPEAPVEIAGAYVRSYRGPQLTFDERATVTALDEGSMPPSRELATANPRQISELLEAGGANNVQVRGVVLDIRESSGLVFRCPEEGCNRVVQKGSCMVHGRVEGTPDLRIKGVLDDGTGALSMVLGREPTSALLGKDVETCVEEARERMNTEFIRDELLDALVARPLVVEGNALSDDYGMTLIGRKARLLDVDVKLEAQELLEQMGV